MAIWHNPAIRQQALQASRQGTLGSFLGSHPQAQASWNQAARRAQGPGMAGQPMGGRQSMLGNRNANAQMTLGQAAGGRPMPGAGRQPAGPPLGSAAPAPPTAQPPQPPGAQGLQPAPYNPSMGMVGGNMYGQGPGAGYGMPQQPQQGGYNPPWGQYGSQQFQNYMQQNPGSASDMSGTGLYDMPGGGRMSGYGGNPYGNPTGIGPSNAMAYQGGGYGQQALNGLMGQVNPGMQSVLQSRLGNTMYGGGYGGGLQAASPYMGAMNRGNMGGGMGNPQQLQQLQGPFAGMQSQYNAMRGMGGQGFGSPMSGGSYGGGPMSSSDRALMQGGGMY